MSGRANIRYPDFVCIGAQKAGTTWLNYILSHHQNIWTPQIKELQYFNEIYIPTHRDWISNHRSQHCARVFAELRDEQERGININEHKFAELVQIESGDISDDWYGKIFAFAEDGQTAGEFTPEYALLPEDGVDHLFRLNSAVKIIFLVRDPIDRAWSHLRMLMSVEQAPMAEVDIVDLARLPDILDRCDYSKTIERWHGFIPASQFLILNYDEIAGDPKALIAKTLEFLGLPALDMPTDVLSERIHEGTGMVIPAAVYETLKDNLAHIYMNPIGSLSDIVAPWRLRHFEHATNQAERDS